MGQIRFVQHSGVEYGTGWRGKREAIKAARRELAQYLGVMTEYERIVINREIEDRRSRYLAEIEAGAIGEWNQAVNNLQSSLDGVKEARRKAQARWDAGKLGAEMQVYNMLVDQAFGSNLGRGTIDTQVITRLKEIYEGAKESGDQYKQRAAGEALRGLLGKAAGADLDSRRELNLLAKQAVRDLAQLDTTPELEAAHETARKNVEALNAARQELFDTAADIGDLSFNGDMHNWNFIKAMNRVQQDEKGNFDIKPLGDKQ